MNAVAEAMHFCPVADCPTMKITETTRRVPYLASEGVSDRWCIALSFERQGKPMTAAVTVSEVGPDEWVANEPIYNKDCAK